MKKLTLYYILFILSYSTILPQTAFSQDKIKIIGEYQYTYGDSENLATAKATCYSMAIRKAIESYKTFVVSTSTVKD